MFSFSVFPRSILLRASEVGANVRDVVEARARALTEGVCGEHGYVRPGSLRMIRMSEGVLSGMDMGGSYRFDAMFKAEVCNPAPGMRVSALVRSVNRFGILCEAGYYDQDNALVPVMEIVVVRSPSKIENEVDVSHLSPGDEVGVEVLGRSYDVRDRRVAVYGRTVLDVDAMAPLGESAEEAEIGREEEEEVEYGVEAGADDLGDSETESEGEDSDVGSEESEESD